MKGEGLAD